MTEENSSEQTPLELPPGGLRIHELSSKLEWENFVLRRQLSSCMGLLDIAMSKLADLGYALETPLDLRLLRAEVQRGAPPLLSTNLVRAVSSTSSSALVPGSVTTPPVGGNIGEVPPTVNSSTSSCNSGGALRSSTNPGSGLSCSGCIPPSNGNAGEWNGGEVAPRDTHGVQATDGGREGGGEHSAPHTNTSTTTNTSSSGTTGHSGIGGGGGTEGMLSGGLSALSSAKASTSTVAAGRCSLPAIPTTTTTSSSSTNTTIKTLASTLSSTGGGTTEAAGGSLAPTTPKAASTTTGAVPSHIMTTAGGSGPQDNRTGNSSRRISGRKFALFNTFRNAHTACIHCCAFAPEGRRELLATGGRDGQLAFHPILEVPSAAKAEGGSSQSSGGASSSLQFSWSIPSAHTECISDLSWLSSTQVVTASFDSFVRVWDVNRAMLRTSEDADGVAERPVEASRWSRRISLEGSSKRGEGGAEAMVYAFEGYGFMLACCSLHNPYLFACSTSRCHVGVADIRAPYPVLGTPHWTERMNAMTYDASSNLLFTGGSDGIITAWDLRKLPAGWETARKTSSNAVLKSIGEEGGLPLSTTLPPSTTTDGVDVTMMSNTSFAGPPSGTMSHGGIGVRRSIPLSPLSSFVPLPTGKTRRLDGHGATTNVAFPPDYSSPFESHPASFLPSMTHGVEYPLGQVWRTNDAISHSGIAYIAHAHNHGNGKRLISVTNGNVVRVYRNTSSTSPSTTVLRSSNGGGVGSDGSGSGNGNHGRTTTTTTTAHRNLPGSAALESFVAPPAGSGSPEENYFLDTTLLPSPTFSLAEEEPVCSSLVEEKGENGGRRGGGEGGEDIEVPMRAAFWKGIAGCVPDASLREEEQDLLQQEVDEAREATDNAAEDHVYDIVKKEEDGSDARRKGGERRALNKDDRRGEPPESERGRSSSGGGGGRRRGSDGTGEWASGKQQQRNVTQRDLLIAGSTLSIGSNGKVYHATVYDVSKSGKPTVVDTLEGHRGNVTGAAVRCTREHFMIATISADCAVRIWTPTRGI